MKEQLIVEMASTAEYETTLVHALYDQNNELLYLNTTTKRPLKVVMHLLVKCMGSLKTQTIHIDDIKMGISNRLKDYLTDSAERPEALGLLPASSSSSSSLPTPRARDGDLQGYGSQRGARL